MPYAACSLCLNCQHSQVGLELYDLHIPLRKAGRRKEGGTTAHRSVGGVLSDGGEEQRAEPGLDKGRAHVPAPQ